MKIQIYENRKVFILHKFFGVNNENNAEKLEITYPEKYANFKKLIEMKNGNWLVVDEIENDEYLLRTNVTKYNEVEAQIVFKDEENNVVFKSEIFKMEFKDALNATKTLDDTNALPSEIIQGKKAYVKGDKITGTMANNGELNYTPTTEAQIIPEGYTSGGIIGAVSSDIDSNIIPTNIRAGVSVLGIEGNLEPDKPDQSKTVTPTTQEQVIRGDTGYELAQVTVNPVTSAIDNNIQAENIKKDIPILGVTGTYEGLNTSDATATASDIASGKTAYARGEKLTGTGELVDWSEYITDTISSGNSSTGGWQSIVKQIKVPSQISGTSCYRMFYGYIGRTLNVSDLDTSNVTNMGNMFSYSSNLTSLDLSSFNTSRVTSMQEMFRGCKNLTSIDVSNFDTSNVTDIGVMFSNCNNLTEIDLSSFNTKKAKSFNSFFENCYVLTNITFGENFSAYTGTNITFSNMFNNCSSLVSLDTTNFKIKYQVIATGNMFANCSNLTNIDVSNWSLSFVSNCNNMFYNCPNLSNDSLNSILKMLTTVSSLLSSNRTLKYLGLSSDQATTCTTLSNWADAQTAGWTTRLLNL